MLDQLCNPVYHVCLFSSKPTAGEHSKLPPATHSKAGICPVSISSKSSELTGKKLRDKPSHTVSMHNFITATPAVWSAINQTISVWLFLYYACISQTSVKRFCIAVWDSGCTQGLYL